MVFLNWKYMSLMYGASNVRKVEHVLKLHILLKQVALYNVVFKVLKKNSLKVYL